MRTIEWFRLSREKLTQSQSHSQHCVCEQLRVVGGPSTLYGTVAILWPLRVTGLRNTASTRCVSANAACAGKGTWSSGSGMAARCHIRYGRMDPTTGTVYIGAQQAAALATAAALWPRRAGAMSYGPRVRAGRRTGSRDCWPRSPSFRWPPPSDDL